MVDPVTDTTVEPTQPEPANEYVEVPPSSAVIKVDGMEHEAKATYAKTHEDANGKLVTTRLHIIFHLGNYVLARRIADPLNPEADTHAIDPNVPDEMKDHLASLNDDAGAGQAVKDTVESDPQLAGTGSGGQETGQQSNGLTDNDGQI